MSCRQRRPTKNSTAKSAAAYTSAVPRSGCMNTRRIGTAPSPMTVKIVFQRVVGPTRSTAKPASASTKRTLPSSDGWNWMTPRSSQRFEPRTVSAATKTTTISPSVAPYTSFQ